MRTFLIAIVLMYEANNIGLISGEITIKKPTILVSLLVRNKAHTLPYFLTLLEKQIYPKDRISLRICSDHNADNSIEILEEWIKDAKEQYHSITTYFSRDRTDYPEESSSAHWTPERFDNVINIREQALTAARINWADYLLSMDADVFLTNHHTFELMTSKNYTVVAPMLKSDGLYSNFWYGMTEDFYYERTEEYKPVLNREKIGCFAVPMVHSCVFVNLKHIISDSLTYVPDNLINRVIPRDDIITFAISAKINNIPMYICNDESYGFIMVPLEKDDSIYYDYMQLTNLKLEILNEKEPLIVRDSFRNYVNFPDKDKLGFDEIFMINLKRRPERRTRMLHCFDELGLDVKVIDAVDGRSLQKSFLENIKFLPEYADPYHKRPMTLGEIGCFMSHYKVWEEIVSRELDTSLVLEDDIRFEPFFRIKVRNLMEEVLKQPGWDLVYFGRKRLQESDEPWVSGSKYLVKVSYSYWTLGYALSLEGARKLLAAEPLSKLLPVDEYFPILFNKHPQADWMKHFPNRNLNSFSAAPLLLYPTHYTGESGYISDTENSVVIENEKTEERDDL